MQRNQSPDGLRLQTTNPLMFDQMGALQVPLGTKRSPGGPPVGSHAGLWTRRNRSDPRVEARWCKQPFGSEVQFVCLLGGGQIRGAGWTAPHPSPGPVRTSAGAAVGGALRLFYGRLRDSIKEIDGGARCHRQDARSPPQAARLSK